MDCLAKVTRSRKWGLGGKPPVSTRCAKVLTKAAPNASLVPFCASRKEHPSLPLEKKNPLPLDIDQKNR